jgi:hypothetical protein
MFLAKFQQVTSDKFKGDKHKTKPFIGEILAGVATGSLINGTMFGRNGLEENVMYACDNFTDEEYPDNIQTRVLSKVSLLEYNALAAQLGAGNLNLATVANGDADPKETVSTPKKAIV